jgi:hypothetical protein
MRERWTEDLVCPNCQKTGRAELSQTDDQSGDIEAELVPAGFKVIQLARLRLRPTRRVDFVAPIAGS